MKRYRRAEARSKFIQLAQIIDRMNDGCETVLAHRQPTDGQEVGHNENASVDTCQAECDAFFNVADSEPLCAFACQDPRNLDGAVTIRVGLDDRHHSNVLARPPSE